MFILAMIVAIIIAAVDNFRPTKFVAFIAKAGGVFAVLWFLLMFFGIANK